MTAAGCRRCTTGCSYRSDVVTLFKTNEERLQDRKSIFATLVAEGMACGNCCSPTHIGSLLYHLRQDGVVERVRTGKFRYRKSDDAAKDFVHAGRTCKTGTKETE